MKRILAVLLAMCMLLCFPIIGTAADFTVSAKAAVLIDGTTGEILYAKNENERLPMASTTKIMSALLSIEHGDLDRVVTTTKEMVTVEGSSMGLLEGDQVSMEALLYGMLLPSGNDAANTTAIAIDGSLDAFAERMNARAREIGMENTNFVTPSGLGHEDHYSTAYDMALLGREAMQNDLFRTISSTKSVRLQYGNPPYDRWLSGHNRLIGSYEGAIGVKTGFTKAAGRCLVSAAERDGALLVAVTLNAPDDWNDHRKMLDYGFSLMEQVELDTTLSADMVKVVGGVKETLSLTVHGDAQVSVLASRKGDIERVLRVRSFVYANIGMGEVVGTIDYELDGKVILSLDVTAAEAVSYDGEPLEEPELKGFKGLIEKIKTFFRRNQDGEQESAAA